MNIASSSVGKYPGSLLLVLILGLLFRLVFIAVHDRPLFSDEKEYDLLAYNLASKVSYSYNTTPTAYRPIGYPAFVGLVYYVFGYHVSLVRLFQALIDIVSAFLVYLLLAGRPEQTRVIGAALWSFFLPAIFYSNLLLSETFFVFLFTLFCWLLTRVHSDGKRKLVALGTLLGVLTLIKPTVAVFVILLPFLIPRAHSSLKQIYPMAIAFVLVLSPWLVRNYLVFGELALSSNGGINLMIGNNSSSTGAYRFPSDPNVAADANGEFEADHKAFRSAVAYIVTNPIVSITNAAKKIGRLFESEGALLVLTFHPSPEDETTHYGTKYASLSLQLVLLTNICYFLIVLAGMFGFLSGERETLWWVALCTLVSWLVIHAVFFGGGRFHFPLMPLMAVYAAQFLREPKKRYGSLSRRMKLFAVAGLTVLCSLWLVEAYVIFYG